MIAVKGKPDFARYTELGRFSIDDVLPLISRGALSFEAVKDYSACELRDEPKLHAFRANTYVHLFRFYESENFVVS